MSPIYAVLTACILFSQGTIFKLYGEKAPTLGKTDDYLFNAINFGSCAIVLLIISCFIGFDAPSLAYGTISGVILCTMIVSYAKSLAKYKIAFVNFILLFAIVIPITVSAIWLDEPIRTLQWAGFGVLVVSAYLVCFDQQIIRAIGKIKVKKNTKSANLNTAETQPENSISQSETQPQTDASIQPENSPVTTAPTVSRARKIIPVLVLILSVVSNGCLSAYIKLSNSWHSGMNNISFLLTTFAVAFAITLTLSLINTRGFTSLRGGTNKMFFIYALCVSAVTVVGNIAFNYFSVRIDAGVFFPITSALPMFLATLVSPLFKEKLSVINLIGIAVGIVGIVLLNL